MRSRVDWIGALLASLALVVLACGSDSGSPPNDDSSQQRYEFTLQSGSTISTPGGDEERLTGHITTSVFDLCCNYYFALRIEALDLQSKSFQIAGTQGDMVARTIGTLGVSAPVEINGQKAQLTGGGGVSTYSREGD
jgi:hypothetical protein